MSIFPDLQEKLRTDSGQEVKSLKFLIYQFLKKDTSGALGYRIYCTYIGADNSKEFLQQEFKHLLHRFPFFLRKLGLKFSEKTLKRVLKFKIADIRAI